MGGCHMTRLMTALSDANLSKPGHGGMRAWVTETVVMLHGAGAVRDSAR
jgi:hypothetical protein